MAKRDELSPQQGEQLKERRPGKVGDRGRTAVANRQFVNGVRWVLRSGARWSDLPARYGTWKGIIYNVTQDGGRGASALPFPLFDLPPSRPLHWDCSYGCRGGGIPW